MKVKNKFKPIINSNSEILILGSLPSVKSREENFYYMNKYNRFWKVLSILYEDDFDNKDINVKTGLLKKYKIALYDTVLECDIDKSKDNTIMNIIPTDIKSLIKGTKIKRIFLNGKTAEKVFKKYNDINIDYFTLPSTSSANARISLNELVMLWEILKK